MPRSCLGLLESPDVAALAQELAQRECSTHHERADHEAEEQEAPPAHAEELDAGEIGKHQLRFIGTGGERKGEDREGGQGAADDVRHGARGSNQIFGARKIE